MKEIIMVALLILIALTILIIIFAILTSISSFKTKGAVFTTTHRTKIKKILDNVPMSPGEVVYDLGCGDGRFLIAAARRYNVKAIGLEINPWAYFLCRLRTFFSGERVSIYFKDFWKEDIRDADIVFCYLFPDVMWMLREKFSKELKDGARVISCNFMIPGWKPEKILTFYHPVHNDSVFIYTNSKE